MTSKIRKVLETHRHEFSDETAGGAFNIRSDALPHRPRWFSFKYDGTVRIPDDFYTLDDLEAIVEHMKAVPVEPVVKQQFVNLHLGEPWKGND